MSRMFGKSGARPAPSSGPDNGLLQRLTAPFGLGRGRARRTDDQRGCFIECELQVGDDDYRMPGCLLRLSSGGGLFRPESAFLMRRDREAAQVILEDRAIAAVVDESAPAGYHLRFPTAVPTNEIREWLSFSRREDVRVDSAAKR